MELQYTVDDLALHPASVEVALRSASSTEFAARMTRTELDPLGPIEVPAQALWGAQTQRSLVHFAISSERMPLEIVHALAVVKSACALVNRDLGLLRQDRAMAIITAAEEVIFGQHIDDFPLSVWQTGSGTHSNMNMNEVLANRASELLGGERGPSRSVHPNDDVNLGQSSNDVFSTAMHVAAARGIVHRLLPALIALRTDPGPEIERLRRRRQDRPHPPPGRDTDHPGPGVLGLCGATRPCAVDPVQRAGVALPARDRRHRRGHRTQHPSRVRRPSRSGPRSHLRSSVRQRSEPLRGHCRPRRNGHDPRRAETARHRLDEACQRRPLAGFRTAFGHR